MSAQTAFRAGARVLRREGVASVMNGAGWNGKNGKAAGATRRLMSSSSEFGEPMGPSERYVSRRMKLRNGSLVFFGSLVAAFPVAYWLTD